MAKKDRSEIKKKKRFHLKFSSEELQAGNRKPDSNYLGRKISSKKIGYIHSLIKNIDQLVIVASFTLPEIKTGLIDRFLILALRFEVNPVIILTKSDLVDSKTIHYYREIYENLGYAPWVVSNFNSSDIQPIKSILKNHASAIIGHSGVGKTTLLNNLDPHYQKKTQEISSFTKKGRHTTSQISLYPLSFGGTIYDMPGLKEMDFINLTPAELQKYYHEFHQGELSCQFKNCSHHHEPHCAVKEKLEMNLIHPERYRNYIKILTDLKN